MNFFAKSMPTPNRMDSSYMAVQSLLSSSVKICRSGMALFCRNLTLAFPLRTPVSYGDNAQHDTATPVLALAVRELFGNLHSLREYANELEERLAKIEPQS
jgi:hypothetical protein